MFDLAIPFWLFAVSCVCALLVGQGIRRYMNNRKILRETEEKEQRKEEKKKLKRIRKQIKKIGKNS